ncbi:V-type proton ATPase 16 kDa proteolipid subunit [Sparganum proliferum]
MADVVPPIYAPFFGIIGTSASMIFCACGAAYGTAKSSMGISCMAVRKPELIMKSLIPIVMAGIIAVYGLVVSVLIAGQVGLEYTLHQSLSHFGAGLSVGLSGLAAGEDCVDLPGIGLTPYLLLRITSSSVPLSLLVMRLGAFAGVTSASV